jgi:signal transduction histidine kinase/DNA-binding response OmpR family regulator
MAADRSANVQPGNDVTNIRPSFWRSVFPRPETDPEFRSYLARLCQEGMFYVGIIAVLATLLYVGLHGILGGRPLGWTYAGDDTAGTIVLWDKVAILGTAALLLSASGRSMGLSLCRGMMATAIIVLSIAILADDLANQGMGPSAGFLTLVFLAGAASTPFRPWQVAAIGFAMLALLVTAHLLAPVSVALDHDPGVLSQIVYFVITVILLTGISTLLYHTRAAQYRAKKHVDALNADLAARTREIEGQARHLRDVEARKSRLFSEVSHELKTPLTLILAPVQDALDGAFGELDQRLRTRLLVIRRNCFQILRLTNDLLDATTLETGRVSLDIRTYDLQVFLRRCVEAFRPLAQKKAIALELSCPEHKMSIRFDAVRMERVINNLLSNAFKFTPGGGQIRVIVEHGEDVRIVIQDSGPGAPSDALPYLFDRPPRSASGNHYHAGGTGIGLSIARDLVEMHGGTVGIRNVERSGFEVVVVLPSGLLESDAREAPLPPSTDGVAFHMREVDRQDVLTDDVDAPTILVVDDSDDLRQYLRSVLEPTYRIVEAINGRTALRIAMNVVPDLVISDVMMPIMDGVELTEALKTADRTRRIPVILLTARNTDDERISGLRAHADDYILKPFSTADLLLRVENLIEIRRLLALSPAPSVSTSPPAWPPPEDDFLKQVDAVIDENMDHSHFGVDWLAGEVGLSTRQLQRRIRQALRLSVGGLIRMKRLQRATHLLDQPSSGVADIAHRVGFHDAAYFSRLFRQTFGETPSEYRERREREAAST